ncbi:histidine--tRNA ligase [Patescibacteria group bacterium]|nr:histidine--tRNA ligase [Patescibacteria group bacterium]
MTRPKFQAPTGMHDIIFTEQGYFKKIYNIVENIANFYRFEKIDTPILEETELFSKGIGLSTDIVQKQMYGLRTKGGDSLTLRPEGTAPIVRAFIEKGMFNLPQPVKLWYSGPFFRYERPQAGRYRQFHQFGFEVLGERNPIIDAQIIQIFFQILKSLKLKNLIIEVNSIGDSQCRPYYKKLLTSYFRSRESSLCANCRRRLRENPLRILDCKEEKCQPIKAQAPQLIDHLCKECHWHFKEVLEFLDELEIPYQLNPYLVRGLDYYTKTVFEIFEDTEEGRKQGALVGGGRYDALVKLLGRKDVPACGGSAGIERIVNLMKGKKIRLRSFPKPKIFLAQIGNLAKRKSLKIIEEFRKAKIEVAESFGRDSLRAQLNRANRIGVKFTLILGQKEALEGTIMVRNMKTGSQKIVKLDKIVKVMKKG